MTIKKEYNIGDNAWIYGISRNNTKPVKGSVVFKFNLSNIGYSKDIVYYVISVPTEIEPLLEVRSWEDISQDEHGPIGMFREIKHIDSTNRKLIKLGLESIDNTVDHDDPTPDEIIKALEKSTEGLVHKPLYIKENKPKRKFYGKKSNYKSST